MKKLFVSLSVLLIAGQVALADSQRCIQHAINNPSNDIQLIINNCSIKDSDLPIIINFLNTHPSFHELYLDNNTISDEGATQLARLTIDYLSLDNNKIGSKGAREIAKSNTLRTIWLDQNPIGDDGAVAFASMQRPINLYLSNTNITEMGAKQLAQNNMMVGLVLDHNRIGDEGIAAFVNSRNLTYFSANDTHLGDKGIAALAKSNSLQWIEVGYNHITDQGAFALAQASGPSHKYLYIANNKLTAVGKLALKNSPIYTNVCTDDNECTDSLAK